MVTKTIAPVPSPTRSMVCQIGQGMLNRDRFSNRPLESWLNDITKLKGKPVIVSIVADTPKDLAQMARSVTVAGAQAIELGLACPNTAGLVPAFEPAMLYDFCVAARKATDLPISAKLTALPSSRLMSDLAWTAMDAGIDALTISDALPGVSVDVQAGSLRLGGPGGFSGSCIRPLSLKAIYDVRKAGISCPILGVGGVRSAEDVLEYLMLGVQVVQVCTALLLDGREALERIAAELEVNLEARGESVDTIRGQAWERIP